MADSPTPSPNNMIAVWAALGSGLVALMLLAVVTPRWGTEGEVNWLITIIGALVVVGLVYAIIAFRRSGTTRAEPPR